MDRTAEAAGHDAELAALRGRIAAVEAILARPGPWGAPAPPTLSALARRVAALERRGGTLPLVVPGGDTSPDPADAPPPRARPAWGDLGQGVLAAALLIALVAWLLRPAAGGGRPGPPAPPAATPPAVPAAPPLAVPAAPAPVPAADACDEQHPARAACAGGATGPPCLVAGDPATGCAPAGAGGAAGRWPAAPGDPDRCPPTRTDDERGACIATPGLCP
jgi:hypothetical protein